MDRPLGVIRRVVVDCGDPAALAAAWAQLLGGPRRDRDAAWSVVPGPLEVAFQRVGDTPTPTGRLHVDVEVEDVAAALARLAAAGFRADGDAVTDAVGTFQVVTDPAGNRLCLVQAPRDAGRPRTAQQ